MDRLDTFLFARVGAGHVVGRERDMVGGLRPGFVACFAFQPGEVRALCVCYWAKGVE